MACVRVDFWLIFYVDEGQSAPNMETAPEWSRLLCDAMDGKVDLIITQKVSNVSRKMHEVTLCSRIPCNTDATGWYLFHFGRHLYACIILSE